MCKKDDDEHKYKVSYESVYSPMSGGAPLLTEEVESKGWNVIDGMVHFGGVFSVPERRLVSVKRIC